MTASTITRTSTGDTARALREFRAMGTSCRVLVDGPFAEVLADAAVERIELLEQCWSRFRATSELMHLNSRAGTGAVAVSADLLTLVRTMQQAWSQTGGLFDPTVIDSMNALGYDRDFAQVSARSSIASDAISAAVVRPAPGMSGIVIDEAAGTITLPAGIGLDPGAIGKGLAADVIVDELRTAGAQAVLVDLGGDIVFAGTPIEGTWAIGIEVAAIALPGKDAEPELSYLDFPAGTMHGAVATSTTLKRRWGTKHHVIDPRTGDVARSAHAQVTVVAECGWRAEAAATCAMLLGDQAEQWLDDHALVHVLVQDPNAKFPNTSNSNMTALMKHTTQAANDLRDHSEGESR